MAGPVSEANGEVLKFGIVASDGREFPKHSHLRSLKLSQVWDHMSPDEASLLTAAHLAHPFIRTYPDPLYPSPSHTSHHPNQDPTPPKRFREPLPRTLMPDGHSGMLTPLPT